MKIIDGEACYSKEELFAEVRRRGLVIYDSFLEEWQKYGVMSKSQRKQRCSRLPLHLLQQIIARAYRHINTFQWLTQKTG